MTEFEQRLETLVMLAADQNVTINPSGFEKIKDNIRIAAKKELWHNAPKELPDCEATCVTFFHGFYRINVWNPYYQCWDDSEDDDFEISGDAELRWMALEVEGEE